MGVYEITCAFLTIAFKAGWRAFITCSRTCDNGIKVSLWCCVESVASCYTEAVSWSACASFIVIFAWLTWCAIINIGFTSEAWTNTANALLDRSVFCVESWAWTATCICKRVKERICVAWNTLAVQWSKTLFTGSVASIASLGKCVFPKSEATIWNA